MFFQMAIGVSEVSDRWNRIAIDQIKTTYIGPDFSIFNLNLIWVDYSSYASENVLILLKIIEKFKQTRGYAQSMNELKFEIRNKFKKMMSKFSKLLTPGTHMDYVFVIFSF